MCSPVYNTILAQEGGCVCVSYFEYVKKKKTPLGHSGDLSRNLKLTSSVLLSVAALIIAFHHLS